MDGCQKYGLYFHIQGRAILVTVNAKHYTLDRTLVLTTEKFLKVGYALGPLGICREHGTPFRVHYACYARFC